MIYQVRNIIKINKQKKRSKKSGVLITTLKISKFKHSKIR
jgi:hypothetical protein